MKFYESPNELNVYMYGAIVLLGVFGIFCVFRFSEEAIWTLIATSLISLLIWMCVHSIYSESKTIVMFHKLKIYKFSSIITAVCTAVVFTVNRKAYREYDFMVPAQVYVGDLLDDSGDFTMEHVSFVCSPGYFSLVLSMYLSDELDDYSKHKCSAYFLTAVFNNKEDALEYKLVGTMPND